MLTRPCRYLCQQRRLTDAGLAAYYDRASLRSGAIDQILDERDLAFAPVEASRGPLNHPATSICRAPAAGMRHPVRPGCRRRSLISRLFLALLRVSLDECEGHFGYLAPAVVDDKRVTTIGKLDDLGHALV